jgi:uncharacterized protein (TIGR02453 family)
MQFEGFGAGAVTFFEDLAANNSRAWWHDNKDRYEADVRAPLERLLADLAGEFGEAKVFRPNRDTRFSPDKTPYKTQAAAGIDLGYDSGSSLYVQLSAEGLMLGGGKFHPAKDQLARLREAIAADRTGRELEGIVADLEKAGAHVSAREALKTAPRGYPADHPRIEYLRMKGIIGVVEHPPGRWLRTVEARDRVAAAWRSFAPLNAWLAGNVGPSLEPPPARGRR